MSFKVMIHLILYDYLSTFTHSIIEENLVDETKPPGKFEIVGITSSLSSCNFLFAHSPAQTSASASQRLFVISESYCHNSDGCDQKHSKVTTNYKLWWSMMPKWILATLVRSLQSLQVDPRTCLHMQLVCTSQRSPHVLSAFPDQALERPKAWL